jgi:hypothetical protein
MKHAMKKYGELLCALYESAWLASRSVRFSHKERAPATNCTTGNSSDNSVSGSKHSQGFFLRSCQNFQHDLILLFTDLFYRLFTLKFSPGFSWQIINMVWNGAVTAQLKTWQYYRLDDSGWNPGMDFVSTQLFMQSKPGALSQEHEAEVRNMWQSTSTPPVPWGGEIHFILCDAL